MGEGLGGRGCGDVNPDPFKTAAAQPAWLGVAHPESHNSMQRRQHLVAKLL